MICTIKISVEDYNQKAQNTCFWGQQQYPYHSVEGLYRTYVVYTTMLTMQVIVRWFKIFLNKWFQISPFFLSLSSICNNRPHKNAN